MTEDDLIETLCRARCDAVGVNPDKDLHIEQCANLEDGPRRWEAEKDEVRRFLAMMKAYEEAKK